MIYMTHTYDIYVSQNQFRVQKTQIYTLDDFLCVFENFKILLIFYSHLLPTVPPKELISGIFCYFMHFSSSLLLSAWPKK